MRRLLAVGLLAAATAVAQQQTFTLEPVLLIENHLYEGRLQEPESVFVDEKRGEIWVADTRNHLIGVFGLDGTPLFAFGSKKRIRSPKQVLVDAGGLVLVLESDRTRIPTFDYRGRFRGDLVPGNFPAKGNITAMAFGPDATLWIAEGSEAEVRVYDYPSMRLRRRFGMRGDEEGQFRSIAGLAVSEKWVCVIDHTGLAVQLFNHRGDFVRGWGQHSLGGQNFSLPRGVAIDAKERIAVTDGLRHDIKYFDLEGRFIGYFGGAGRAPGSVSFPAGIAITADGRVYVADRGNARVQVFQTRDLP